MIDSHCHIHFNGFKKDFEQVMENCQQKNCQMITVGTQKDTSQKALDFANKYDNIYASVGLHPIHLFSTQVDEEESSFLSREEEFDYDYYKNLAQQSKTVAIGECGMELFHLPANANKEKILIKQKDIFAKQIDLANELNLPVIIHIRDAHTETLKFLRQLKQKPRAVVHCFSGASWAEAEQYLNMGFYLGFTGIITFPARKTNPQPTLDLLEVVLRCPLERMLVETDAPYLAPQAYRGKRCEPWIIEEVIKKISEIKKIKEQTIAIETYNNTKKLFTKIY
jgi:TatD DNase family protein